MFHAVKIILKAGIFGAEIQHLRNLSVEQISYTIKTGYAEAGRNNAMTASVGVRFFYCLHKSKTLDNTVTFFIHFYFYNIYIIYTKGT